MWLTANGQRPTAKSQGPMANSAEGRQVDEVVLGDGLERVSGFAPGLQPAYEYERIESLFSEQMRHPGARGFACSSAIDINVFVARQVLYFFLEVIGFDPDRSLDALGAGVIIAVTADVNHHYLGRLAGFDPAGKFLHRNPGYELGETIFAEDPGPIGYIRDQANDDHQLHDVPGGGQALDDRSDKITENKAQGAVREHVQANSDEIKCGELPEGHFHAAGQRRRHGVDAGYKLGEHKCGAAALVKRFCRAEDARFRIHRQLAQEAE